MILLFQGFGEQQHLYCTAVPSQMQVSARPSPLPILSDMASPDLHGLRNRFGLAFHYCQSRRRMVGQKGVQTSEIPTKKNRLVPSKSEYFRLLQKRENMQKKTWYPEIPSLSFWLREPDLNRRPPGYEPDELPDCSIPRYPIA